MERLDTEPYFEVSCIGSGRLKFETKIFKYYLDALKYAEKHFSKPPPGCQTTISCYFPEEKRHYCCTIFRHIEEKLLNWPKEGF